VARGMYEKTENAIKEIDMPPYLFTHSSTAGTVSTTMLAIWIATTTMITMVW
jgi:hypothetical protein